MRVILAALLLCYVSLPALAQSGARFSGNVQAEWLDLNQTDSAAVGRDMRVLRALEYFGPDGQRWSVPEGVTVNGASIPPPFWSIIGSPFTGRYRAASVVHDYYCDKSGLDPVDGKRRTASDVHKMFHDAMLTAGVSAPRAQAMYRAVQACGPRWDPTTGVKQRAHCGKDELARVAKALAAALRQHPQ